MNSLMFCRRCSFRMLNGKLFDAIRRKLPIVRGAVDINMIDQIAVERMV